MKYTRICGIALGIWLIILVAGCSDESGEKRIATQNDEAAEATVFASGEIATNREQNVSFTPDGLTVFFERASAARGTLYAAEFANGQWGEPYIPGFALEGESEGNAFVSPDGAKVYFTSTRPGPGSLKGNYDIWYAERSAEGWGDAIPVGEPVNTKYGETYPAVSASGHLYFNSARPDSNGLIAIYRSSYTDGAYGPAELLGEAINNGRNHVLTPYIAPDESYLIFCLAIDETDADLYISYNQDGEWLPAEPLSQAVNLAGSIETAPSVSPDGETFYFSRLTGTGADGGTIYQIDAAQAGIKTN